jgi:hypothetical protein
MSEFRPLTTGERDALRQRTTRALTLIWSFQGMPVQVGSPCSQCGGLYWWITGNQRIAPSGYCLNCRPGELEGRPALLRLVAESMLDLDDEEDTIPTPDIPDIHSF